VLFRSSVITTHLASVVNHEAAEILTRQDVSDLIDQLKETHPAVVQELIPGKLSIGHVHRVLQGLLRERVPIRDLPVILETLSDHAGRSQEVTVLVELCRRALGARITRDRIAPDGSLKAIGFHPDLEALIRKASHRENIAFGPLALDPAMAREILQSLKRGYDAARSRGLEPVLVCSPAIRPQARQLVQHEFRDMAVLSLAEIPEAVRLEVVFLVPLPTSTETETLLTEPTK
jgi:flagellar biosynthesis protein FlhA